MTKEEKNFYKQLHHIIRLYDCLNYGVNFYKYSEVEREYMLDIKRGRFPGSKEKAEEMRDKYITRLNEIYEEKKLAYEPQEVDYDTIDEIVMKYLCKCQ